jgi:hypothetical protein
MAQAVQHILSNQKALSSNPSMVYICIYTVHTDIYIYIYIHRHTHIYIYIYIKYKHSVYSWIFMDGLMYEWNDWMEE